MALAHINQVRPFCAGGTDQRSRTISLPRRAKESVNDARTSLPQRLRHTATSAVAFAAPISPFLSLRAPCAALRQRRTACRRVSRRSSAAPTASQQSQVLTRPQQQREARLAQLLQRRRPLLLLRARRWWRATAPRWRSCEACWTARSQAQRSAGGPTATPLPMTMTTAPLCCATCATSPRARGEATRRVVNLALLTRSVVHGGVRLMC